VIGFTTPFSGCRRLLITEPREGGSLAAPFPWTPSLAHTVRHKSTKNKENVTPRYVPSAQAHPVLESSRFFRLILYWNQTPIPGSFQDWKMLEL